MANGTRNPDPQRTVWTIIGLVIGLVLLVGSLALNGRSPGIFRPESPGGMLPALFVAVAIVVGVCCVGFFLHRGTQPRK